MGINNGPLSAAPLGIIPFQAKGIDIIESKTSAPVQAVPSPPAPPVTPAPRPPVPTPDTVKIQAGGGETPKARTFDVQARFDTGSAQAGKSTQPDLNRTLDAVVASIKTLPPEKQKALLADPNFKIEIEGHASNLGSAKKYDNIGLSKRRAESAAAYVQDYLKQRGIDVPPTAVTARGSGTPGPKKPNDDNDPADRSASIHFNLPGLDPLPPAPVTPAPAKPADKPAEPKPVEQKPVATTPATPATPTDPSASGAALNDFNKLVLPVGDLLTKGRAGETSLADREALVTKAQEALKQSEGLLPKLDPSAQLGAQALINSYKDQVGGLAERAAKERSELNTVLGQIKGNADQLGKLSAGKDKGALKKQIDTLQETYKNPDELGKGLPEDARKSIKQQVGDLMKQIRDAIARNVDSSDIDRVDNSYLLGRPGPKFKKSWEGLQAFIQTPTPSPEQRRKAIEQLKEMGDAVNDFEDVQAKAATQSVYDEVSRAVAAKLAAN